jgi:uncharacterized protein YqjF (DUF2071 family)
MFSTPAFLTAEWRALLMLNYAVDPALLARHVPHGTELDLHEGRAWVSVVAFRFLNTRILGVPAILHEDFEEVNIRFYVRRDAREGERHGVVFLREIVAKPIIAVAARTLVGEPYLVAPTYGRTSLDPPRLEYGWQQDGTWSRLSARAEGPGAVPPAGSHEDFIIHKAWGYTPQADGGTLEYEVVHPRWTAWSGTLDQSEMRLDVFGDSALAASLRDPASVIIAAGSAIELRRPHRMS